jgi:hypothetical protein
VVAVLSTYFLAKKIGKLVTVMYFLFKKGFTAKWGVQREGKKRKSSLLFLKTGRKYTSSA